MTSYRLIFDHRAAKSWNKLGSNIRNQFEKKLRERLRDPEVASARLREFPNCYRIKLAAAGYRLIYQVQNDRLIVFIVSVGKREGEEAYEEAAHVLATLR